MQIAKQCYIECYMLCERKTVIFEMSADFYDMMLLRYHCGKQHCEVH